MARPLAWGDTLVNVLMVDVVDMTPLNLLVTLTSSDTISTMRIVGHLMVIPENLDTNVVYQQGVNLGIGVASVEAFTANVLPDPSSPSESPPRGWLWVDELVQLYSNSATFGVEVYSFPEVRFDIRSSRKVDRGVLFLNGRSISLGNTGESVRLVGRIRVLCAT